MLGDRLLLPLLLAIPIVGAVAAALMGAQRATSIRRVSLAATLSTLALSIIIAWNYVESAGQAGSSRTRSDAPLTFTPQMVPGADASGDPSVTTWDLLNIGPGSAAIQFYVGIDGMNVWLVVLTCLLMCSAVLVSWDSSQVQERVNEYYAWLLALQTGMLGVFVSFDIVLFYVFFELTLVPLFFLIGIWGGPQRRYAARKFFVYTLTGSL